LHELQVDISDIMEYIYKSDKYKEKSKNDKD